MARRAAAQAAGHPRPVSTARARAEWAARVRAEYRSAALAARAFAEGVVCGLPRPVLDAAARVAADELDHAELSHAAWESLGGSGAALALEVGALLPAGGGAVHPLAALVDAAVQDFCVGETLAVPLFAAMRGGATGTPRAVLDRILADEARHRAFGWSLLDALLALDPPGVRARAADALPAALAGSRAAYGDLPVAAPLCPEEREAGLLEPAEYAEIWAATVEGQLRPAFAARGIVAPALPPQPRAR